MTYPLLLINPVDRTSPGMFLFSEIQGFGDRDTCDSQRPPVPYVYQGSVIENPMRMKVWRCSGVAACVQKKNGSDRNNKRGQVLLNSEGHRSPDELGPAVAIHGIL